MANTGSARADRAASLQVVPSKRSIARNRDPSKGRSKPTAALPLRGSSRSAHDGYQKQARGRLRVGIPVPFTIHPRNERCKVHHPMGCHPQRVRNGSKADTSEPTWDGNCYGLEPSLRCISVSFAHADCWSLQRAMLKPGLRRTSSRGKTAPIASAIRCSRSISSL